MMDTHRRTLLKTITWRAIATTTTIAVIYIWTGDLGISFVSGIVANLLKTLFYYVHERVWNSIRYGTECGITEEEKEPDIFL